MIVSASRRTDIPRWYTPWLMNRLRAQTVLIQNPMNPRQLSRLSLSPDVVDCIVFWSKDPAPLLPHLDEIARMGHAFYFQFTITPYGRDMEAFLRSKEEIGKTLLQLSAAWGKERVLWRYDPILFTDHYTLAWHKQQFEAYCQRFCNAVDTVTISFVDDYKKTEKLHLRPISQEEMIEMAAFCGDTAKKYGLRTVACAESGDFSAYGVDRAACIDPARMERILGCPLKLSPDRNQRSHCGCCQSVDIGMYHSCCNGCLYCYATSSIELAKSKMTQHDPMGELLIGRADDAQIIRKKAAESNKIGQLQWNF